MAKPYRTKKAKYESCVKQLKTKNGKYNPFAVCKSSIYNKDKFNSYQLKKGTKVEMEHTNNPKIAEKIAIDHLKENPNYYKDLNLRSSEPERLVN